MIFYFSGTGNSRWVAERLANLLNDHFAAIADALCDSQFSFSLSRSESVGFVFPTYSWGPTPVMLDFIKQMQLRGITSSTYCYMVTTCGDDIGLCAKIWRKAVAEKGLTGSAAFSVQMPNTYVNMKGFDVDSEAVASAKLDAAPATVERIATLIAERRCVTEVNEGNWAWVKSRIVRPWFIRNAMNPRGFRADASRCTHCGKCVKVCPLRNVSLNASQLPEWGEHCAMCLACLHHCTAKAVQYRKATQDKGRYTCPLCSRF